MDLARLQTEQHRRELLDLDLRLTRDLVDQAAIVSLLADVDVEEAARLLTATGGRVRDALEA